MLKDWNRSVRMTSASISACTITRTVSENPPCLGFCSVDALMDFCSIGRPRVLHGNRDWRLSGLVDEVRCDPGQAGVEPAAAWWTVRSLAPRGQEAWLR